MLFRLFRHRCQKPIAAEAAPTSKMEGRGGKRGVVSHPRRAYPAFTSSGACLETMSTGGMLHLFHRSRSEQHVMKATRPRHHGLSRMSTTGVTRQEPAHASA